MIDNLHLVEDIFYKGLSLDKAERQALLETLGADQSDVAKEVRELWASDGEDAFDFNSLSNLSMHLLAEEIDKKDPMPKYIGQYRIDDVIGSGGTSMVYRATQKEPLEREVALKVLNLSVAAGEHASRFMAEQALLARLAHPYIATVFDSGITEDGSPFFSMEYLHGQTITAYCDHYQLDIEARLRLFLKVCDGVTHAHQRGAVHRDLKPGNVLVVGDPKDPTPKIIDFGVAKWMSQDTPAPYQTQVGMVIGTPHYMSPEQASGRHHELVDTRSDIYALGIILYELLVGVTPLGDKIEAAGSMRAACAVIEEGEAPQVSLRPIPGDEASEQAASLRGCDALTLAKRLREDLDWILLKALAREPRGRYQAVSEFKQDVARHLEGLPVSVSHPGSFYQFRKVLARHRGWVRVAGAVSAAFLLGFAGTVYALIETAQARENAQVALRETQTTLALLQRVRGFNKDIFETISPYGLGGDVTGRRLLENAAQQIPLRYNDEPELEAVTRLELGHAFSSLGEMDQARKQLEQALVLFDRHPNLPGRDRCLNSLAFVFGAMGELDQAEQTYTRVLELHDKGQASEEERLEGQTGLALIYHQLGHKTKAHDLYKKTLQRQEELGVSWNDQHATRNNLGLLLLDMNNVKQAETIFRENVRSNKQQFGGKHPHSLSALHNLGLAFERQGEMVLARKAYKEAWLGRQQVLGEHHRETLRTLNNYAVLCGSDQGAQVAIDLLEPIYRNLHKVDLGEVGYEIEGNFGHFLKEVGDYSRADAVLRSSYESAAKTLGSGHLTTLKIQYTLGEALLAEGKEAEALRIFENVADAGKKALSPKDPYLRIFRKTVQDLRKK